MIKEITQFVDEIKEQSYIGNIELKEGLYLLLDIQKKNNKVDLVNFSDGKFTNDDDILIYKKNDEKSKAYSKFLNYQQNSIPVSHNKSFVLSAFDSICSPFGIGFKKDFSIDKKKETIAERKVKVKKYLDEYFKNAQSFVLTINHKEWFFNFKEFCDNQFFQFIETLDEYQKAKSGTLINMYLKMPSIDDYKETYQKYLSERVFNTDKINQKIGDAIYGISDSLNTFSGKKAFFRHQTSPLDLNYRVTGETAMKLWKFFQLQKQVLPNPLPIFIDKDELLNEKIISIFNEDRKMRYAEMIKRLFENHQKDLSDYYLLFVQRREIVDFDFVPSFRYNFKEEMIISNLFGLNEIPKRRIENIFEFEEKIISKIFNNILVSIFRNDNQQITGTELHYFTELTKEKNKFIKETLRNRRGLLNLILKYRKAIYDYIYKSKIQAFTNPIFHDILFKNVLDDIRLDKFENNKHSYWKPIREKLNIWFSLYNYFNINNQNKENMANKIEKHREMIIEVATGKKNIQDDDEFAFAAGQVIYYLMSKSKSADRSYSRLEPFLQKSDYIEFRKALRNTFNMYKHENFSTKFKNPFANVMDYVPDSTNFKEIIPTLLAGFFSECALFADKEKKEIDNEIENINN